MISLPPALASFFDRMRTYGDAPALVSGGREQTYSEVLRAVSQWAARLEGSGIQAGSVCVVAGDYAPNLCGVILGLIRLGAVVVPLTREAEPELHARAELSEAEWILRFDEDDRLRSHEIGGRAKRNPLLREMAATRRPGLIIFTSGSTGQPKAILHDCERVFSKFVTPRKGWRTLLFLMLDHFGGFNTLVAALANGGAAVCVSDRSPESICRVTESARVTLLPVTPTFLSFLVASGCYRQYDLSSVELISYGAEVMPEHTLEKVRQAFPNAQLKQTYGLSETGVLRSSSEPGSTWVRVGGDGFDVKVVDGILWVQSQSRMLGYLNAPSPFDAEGWMCTGDRVEVRGDYLRILGRDSDMINVGGQKVSPGEVETVLLEVPGVTEAAVFGVAHPLMGQVVHAAVATDGVEEERELIARIRRHCMTRLGRYKLPIRIRRVAAEALRTSRFKKNRDWKSGAG